MNATTGGELKTRPPSRRWSQFSLLWLLVLLAVGCLTAAWCGEMQRRKRVERALQGKEAENRELRIALGILDDRPKVLSISDRTQVHVKMIPPPDDLHWRWRVFVPPGNSWMLQTSFGEEWDDDRQRYFGGGGGSGLSLDGEFTLDARIAYDFDGRPYLEILQGSRRSGRIYLPEGGVAIHRGKGKLTPKFLGGKQQASLPAQGEIEFLRWYREVEVLPSNESNKGPKGFGFSIHLEDEAHQQARFKNLRAARGQ